MTEPTGIVTRTEAPMFIIHTLAAAALVRTRLALFVDFFDDLFTEYQNALTFTLIQHSNVARTDAKA